MILQNGLLETPIFLAKGFETVFLSPRSGVGGDEESKFIEVP